MLKLVCKHYFEYNKKHKLKILKTIYYVEGTYIYRLIIGSKITRTRVIINNKKNIDWQGVSLLEWTKF